MKEHRQRIVEYVVGDAEKEKRKMVENYVECRIVLVAHNCQGHSTPSAPSHWGQRGYYPGIVNFEFFESFLLIYSPNTHWANFEFFQKLLTTLIKTYSLGNFRN